MIRHPVLLSLGLLALLACAPLPFGSVTPWGTAIVELAGFVILAWALLLGRTEPLPRAVRNVALALVALAALGLAQSLDWPAGLVRVVSSEHLRLGRESSSMLDLPSPEFVSLSLAPATSRRIALVWLLNAAAFLSGAILGRARRGRRAIFSVLAASALFQVGFGFKLLGRRMLWGIELPWRRDGLRGTFVNSNHTATYLLIVVTALFAFVWWLQRRVSRRHWLEQGLLRLGPAALLWVAVLVGLALTGSRAGLVAGLAGLALQATLVSLGGARRRALLIGAAALAVVMVALATIGFRSGLDRLLDPTEGGGVRLGALADTTALFGRFPFTGVGLGGFRAAFPLAHVVDRQYAGSEWMWWHAHNDWLELAATTGVVGLAIAIFGVVALARGLRQSWLHGARSEDRAAALAAIGACVAVGLQELLDFGLTIPANSVTLAVVCGAALAVPLKQETAGAISVETGPDNQVPVLREPTDASEPNKGSEARDGNELSSQPEGEALDQPEALPASKPSANRVSSLQSRS